MRRVPHLLGDVSTDEGEREDSQGGCPVLYPGPRALPVLLYPVPYYMGGCCRRDSAAHHHMAEEEGPGRVSTVYRLESDPRRVRRSLHALEQERREGFSVSSASPVQTVRASDRQAL